MSDCKHCGQEIPLKQMRVSIHGMYDMHLFISFHGGTVDEVIADWQTHNEQKHPAIVGDREVEDLGKASLCPVDVLGTNVTTGKEISIRLVGPMVHHGSKNEKEQLAEWYEAVTNDPDIPRLLDSPSKVD